MRGIWLAAQLVPPQKVLWSAELRS